jgi:iron complex transport system substrate-binding protein
VRIASLLPSATEIVCALGLVDDLVAITHECDYPPSLRGKPVVTSSVLDGGPRSSAEIDRHIRHLVHEGSSIYALDAEALHRLGPDLILTQELCEVCAVSYPIVERAARSLEADTKIVSLEPERLDDVFENIRLVGRLTGREGPAAALIEALERRIDSVKAQLEGRPPRPVVCLEWIDPLYNCGHWTPELVGIAGGSDPLGVLGLPARPMEWETVTRSDPDAIVVMACGFSLARSLQEVSLLEALPDWDQLRAVRDQNVFVVDGNAFFSRPGPRLVDSVEILAGLLHPDVVPAPSPDTARRWEPVRP